MTKHVKKIVREGELVAEVDVELQIDDDAGWSPYISVSDASKLDDARDALKKKDVQAASKFGRVFRLTPVA